ncbi:hypothetical protein BV25DRAFT_1841640 [Artomyces pyxidatus]|uniref:Uncharacterized protein n=1 Tax=Artomyces pyxidatus TaxID=48021 RepID=A0ACB8SN58_9AGAM|nr:hypothetical protein BV25DRAFT_1841640 [Artomyces pyxidatus]
MEFTGATIVAQHRREIGRLQLRSARKITHTHTSNREIVIQQEPQTIQRPSCYQKTHVSSQPPADHPQRHSKANLDISISLRSREISGKTQNLIATGARDAMLFPQAPRAVRFRLHSLDKYAARVPPRDAILYLDLTMATRARVKTSIQKYTVVASSSPSPVRRETLRTSRRRGSAIRALRDVCTPSMNKRALGHWHVWNILRVPIETHPHGSSRSTHSDASITGLCKSAQRGRTHGLRGP